MYVILVISLGMSVIDLFNATCSKTLITKILRGDSYETKIIKKYLKQTKKFKLYMI